MEYDCHIFSKYLVFQTKNLAFHSKKICISIKNLGFRSKYLVFRIRNFKILGFSHLVFEIIGILLEMVQMEIPGFLVDFMYVL